MRRVPRASSRQTELKRAIGLPAGSRTGPVECAGVPSASTTTCSGAHENGASFASKKRFQAVATAGLPFSTFAPKNTACSDRCFVNAA